MDYRACMLWIHHCIQQIYISPPCFLTSSHIIWDMCICHTSKHSQVSDKLPSSTPCFFWNSVHDNFGWASIQDVHCIIYSFIPILIKKMFFLQHTSDHVHDGPILPSSTPFCWGVYLVVNYLCMPFSLQKRRNSLEIYSQPLSVLSTLMYCPLCFSKRGL